MSYKVKLLWKIDFAHINMFHIEIGIYSEVLKFLRISQNIIIVILIQEKINPILYKQSELIIMSVKFGFQHGTNAAYLGLKTKDYLKSIQYCENSGYNSIFMMDHLNSSPMNSEVVSSNVILPIAASQTEKVKIGSCVTDPHRRHPSQIALDALTIQRLSNDRFILGIGAGEAMNLNEFGITWDKPASRLIEAVEVIKELWKTTQSSKARVDYTGKFFNLKGARLQYPIKNMPKLWIAANSPRLIEFTGRVADGWLPICNAQSFKNNLEILGKGGRLNEIEKACEVFVVVSKDKPDIAREMGKSFGLAMSVNSHFLEEYNVKLPEKFQHRLIHETLSDMAKSQREAMEFAKENIPEEVIDSLIIFGSPEDCIEQIEEFIKVGVEHFLIEVFGLGNYFQSLELFTDSVLSYFKEIYPVANY
jgi:phthiodiolone/phenolphthiodiolone dimycocerosates ketoreductase